VSTLWTPSGEHPIPRPGDNGPGDDQEPGTTPRGAGTAGPAPGSRAPAGGRRGAGIPDERAGGRPSPEEVRRAQEEMEAVRQELLRAPVELVIANHAMGLWELAALHLSERPPHLPEAQLAIDALSALVEGVTGRLGEGERALRDGLAEIRMAFVQIHNAERARLAGEGA